MEKHKKIHDHILKFLQETIGYISFFVFIMKDMSTFFMYLKNDLLFQITHDEKYKAKPSENRDNLHIGFGWFFTLILVTSYTLLVCLIFVIIMFIRIPFSIVLLFVYRIFCGSLSGLKSEIHNTIEEESNLLFKE